MPTVSALYVYPIKSLGGISLQQSLVNENGLQFDRRWMIVDKNGVFISQRTHANLTFLQTSIEADKITICNRLTNDHIDVPFLPKTKETITVTIWDDVCEAQVVNNAINEWLSDYLQQSVSLVYMPDSTKRLVDKRYAISDTYTHFADGYPFMLIGEASLQELNQKAGTNLDMNRFRPNIVVADTAAQEEEQWHETQIGSGLYTGVKPCTRCILTTINQTTGEKGKEPLRTLATYKKEGNRILFGQNMVYNGGGNAIAVGDNVIVKTRRKTIFLT